MLASPFIKLIVSDKCYKRERQVNQSHASGSDNFNGAEEVLFKILGYFVNGSKYLGQCYIGNHTIIKVNLYSANVPMWEHTKWPSINENRY